MFLKSSRIWDACPNSGWCGQPACKTTLLTFTTLADTDSLPYPMWPMHFFLGNISPMAYFLKANSRKTIIFWRKCTLVMYAHRDASYYLTQVVCCIICESCNLHDELYLFFVPWTPFQLWTLYWLWTLRSAHDGKGTCSFNHLYSFTLLLYTCYI